jgi:hypothetical protein
MKKVNNPVKIFSKIVQLIDALEKNSPERHYRFLKNASIKENLMPISEKEAKKTVFLIGTYNELINPVLRGFGFEIHGYYPDKKNMVERTYYFPELKKLGTEEIIFQTFGEANKKFRTDLWSHAIVPESFKNCYTNIKDPAQFEAKIQKEMEEKLETLSEKNKKEIIIQIFENYCHSFSDFWDKRLEKIKEEGIREINNKKEIMIDNTVKNFDELRFYGGMKRKLLETLNKRRSEFS